MNFTLKRHGDARRTMAGALLACGLLIGCGLSVAQEALPLSAPSSAPAGADAGVNVVFRALALLGIPYRYGSDDPVRGLDCSGLVRRVFLDLFSLDLPHNASQLGHQGQAVGRSELAPGDLLFFHTLRRPYSHVAIYIGDGRFVHAPGRGSLVRLDVLDEPYWLRRFDGARRVLAQSAAEQ